MLDANAEAGTRLELVLPESWAKGALVERAARKNEPSAQLSVYAVPESSGVVELASLEPVAARGDARGPDEVFQNLFARPYGPVAFAAYVADRKSRPPEVYGVSREDTLRMQLVLSEIEQAERNQRILAGSGLLGAGVLLGAIGATRISLRQQNSRIFAECGSQLGNLRHGSRRRLRALGGLFTRLFKV